jgi:hypothetical protein
LETSFLGDTGLEVVVEAVADIGDFVGLVAADHDDFGKECLAGFGDTPQLPKEVAGEVEFVNEAAGAGAVRGLVADGAEYAPGDPVRTSCGLTRERNFSRQAQAGAESWTSAIGKSGLGTGPSLGSALPVK